MGAAISQVARRSAKSVHVEPSKPRGQMPAGRLNPTNDRAFIERDGQDPDFMANLRRLGQVRVDHTVQPPSSSLSSQILESRAQAEMAVSNQAPGIIPVSMLHQLLDKRKNIRTRSEFATLTEQYGVDQESLNKLTAAVNSPSVRAGSGLPSIDKETGEERTSIAAIWIEPRIE
ncbi:hypothetical protein AX17_004371 [Amanita inopinata Kibby_2008]|nr:hypothetical protein AX17_004371 [Amanita inopinata Kibby_2008]